MIAEFPSFHNFLFSDEQKVKRMAKYKAVINRKWQGMDSCKTVSEVRQLQFFFQKVLSNYISSTVKLTDFLKI